MFIKKKNYEALIKKIEGLEKRVSNLETGAVFKQAENDELDYNDLINEYLNGKADK